MNQAGNAHPRHDSACELDPGVSDAFAQARRASIGFADVIERPGLGPDLTPQGTGVEDDNERQRQGGAESRMVHPFLERDERDECGDTGDDGGVRTGEAAVSVAAEGEPLFPDAVDEEFHASRAYP